jgi:hypothetical protein
MATAANYKKMTDAELSNAHAHAMACFRNAVTGSPEAANAADREYVIGNEMARRHRASVRSNKMKGE